MPSIELLSQKVSATETDWADALPGIKTWLRNCSLDEVIFSDYRVGPTPDEVRFWLSRGQRKQNYCIIFDVGII